MLIVFQQPASVVSDKFVAYCCAIFWFWRGATKEHPLHGAVTEEQRSPNQKSAQPEGRQVFCLGTSLFVPYRPMKGMLVTHASSQAKILCRNMERIYHSPH